jgi:hypothetical protein
VTTSEQHVATLVFPTEYLRQLNSVAGLTTQSVIFLKRKFLSDNGWELVKYPLADCASIDYKEELPVLKIFFGAALLCLVLFIFAMLAIYWDDLEPGTRMPVGLVCLAGIYGARVAFGGRRHRIDVTLRNGSKLTWKSRSGDYKLMLPIVERFVEYSQSAGLMPRAAPTGERR